MRRTPVLLFAAFAVAALAACGASEAGREPTATPRATATATASSNATQVSSGRTVTPDGPAPSPSPSTAATVPAETPTVEPTKASATTAATVAPPTPTKPPATGNPLAAAMGVTGTARYFWSPSSVTIAPGGLVTFAWSGGAAHDVSIPALGFESPGGPTVDASFAVPFPGPGEYQVICVIHKETMRGKVIVE